MSEDPLFVQPGYWDAGIWIQGDYHITGFSPCIDAGDAAGASQDDIDGELRSVADIGADEYSDLGTVGLHLLPDDVQIPAGDTLGYSANAVNNTASNVQIEYWTDVTMPDGATHPSSAVLVGPHSVQLEPFGTRSEHLTHRIPQPAPLGVYTYNAYIGTYPADVVQEFHFNFEVVGTR
ncbi:MAG: hypothetical protein C4532_06075 [Candidatus Abyssobacteria bacterium SURF_17]|uniref:Uncharacterized protein n=1 Tax=Candidatus Abyssobacteria bacterium SURF_17 TaxID=2093361 RepID=A0A419F2G5_9BACT|nr:MAG: hypothetical protein C4532_06075 [Candidatus Abyssubacteria bacterium SURF_17]